MHPARRPRPALLLVPLLIMVLAGCIQDPLTTDAPAATPRPDPRAPSPVPPAFSLALYDARSDALATPTAGLTIVLDRPLDNETLLHIVWTPPAGPERSHEVPLPPDALRFTLEEAFDDLAPGDHDLRAAASWGNTSPTVATDLGYRVWAPLRLVLDAPEEHAGDQNPFHTDLLVPFAPWDDDSALEILQRAAERHDFTVEATYQDDMEAHFVEAINGTAFRWELEAAGVSRNWMLLVDDEVTGTAADRTYPTRDEVVTFRYTRCSAAGCEDV